MDIVLLGEFGHEDEALWRAELAAAWPQAHWLRAAEAQRHAARVRAAVVANPPPGSLQAFPQLELIQSLWAGVDRLLADPTLPPGVPLARMVDPAMSAAMAETVLWATLALQRGFFDYQRQQRERVWRPLPQRRADAVRVSVLGLGAMGQAAAAAIAAQGFRVTGWAARERELPAGLRGVFGAAALAALLPATDVLINLLPLTPATRGLLDARLFGALAPGAGVVNLARGAHVVDADLLAALDRGHLRHAVLDVFQTEPLPADHAYWAHPNVTLLPHAAAATDPRSAARIAVANLRALAEGRPLAHLVDRARGY